MLPLRPAMYTGMFDGTMRNFMMTISRIESDFLQSALQEKGHSAGTTTFGIQTKFVLQ